MRISEILTESVKNPFPGSKIKVPVYHGTPEKFYFFQIPVELVGSKLENKVKDSMIKIYPSAKQELIDLGFRTFLMAQYGNSV